MQDERDGKEMDPCRVSLSDVRFAHLERLTLERVSDVFEVSIPRFESHRLGHVAVRPGFGCPFLEGRGSGWQNTSICRRGIAYTLVCTSIY